MKRLIFAVFAAGAVLTLAAPFSSAQEEMRVERVTFPAGTTGTTISDRITGRESVLYKVSAEAGQQMYIQLDSNNGGTYFNVYEPGSGPGDQALAVSEITGPLVPDLNRFSGTLQVSGEYSVSIYLYRNAARRGEVSDYTLDISITGAMGGIVEGDFADGLQGGPDFWRVNAGGGLNLRSGPSAAAEVLVMLPNGLELRNLGCRIAEGRRWCEVSTPEPAVRGWVAGEYLSEASGESMTQFPAMVPVDNSAGNQDRPVGGVRPEGSAFTATGLTDCTLTRDAASRICEFGVIREGGGNGAVTIFWPDTGTRVIFFQDGTPISFDQSQADAGKEMTVSRDGDTSIVLIGDERYVLPDSIIFGG